jgi:aminopeptidase N
MRRRTAWLWLVGCASLALVLLAPTASPVGSTETDGRPGSAGLGDYLVRAYGNGGYDVAHYRIEVGYRPATGRLRGMTTLRAVTTQDLSRFNLDFVLPVRSVSVNGRAADFETVDRRGMAGRELVVKPAAALSEGSVMRVKVAYSAVPARVKVAGYSGWHPTPTGVNAWDAPTAASQWWFPSNAHPSDKATYDIVARTPARLKAISNGRLVSRVVHGRRATTHWRSGPLATYLTFLAIGDYRVARDRAGGVPAWYAHERGGGIYVERAWADVRRTPGVIRFLSRRFGPYPFDSAGGLVFRHTFPTAFETQTRPQYTALMWRYNPHNMWVVVHEIAHQWFGDSVTMRRWRHIWLSEGFATYGEWLWSAHRGTGTPQQLFRAAYQLYPRDDWFWTVAVTHPEFALDPQVYERGAMTLQALRNKIGQQAFFTILRRWPRERHHATASTADFVALAERISGRQFDRFFDVWLRTRSRPAPTIRNGFPADMTARPAPPALAAIAHNRQLLHSSRR